MRRAGKLRATTYLVAALVLYAIGALVYEDGPWPAIRPALGCAFLGTVALCAACVAFGYEYYERRHRGARDAMTVAGEGRRGVDCA